MEGSCFGLIFQPEPFAVNELTMKQSFVDRKVKPSVRQLELGGNLFRKKTMILSAAAISKKIQAKLNIIDGGLESCVVQTLILNVNKTQK